MSSSSVPARRREVVAVMTKLGFIGFGGPAAHIALMRDEAVVKRDWLTEHEFVDLLGAASALPGPTSTQLSMLLSKRRAGWFGLFVGGSCFILPAMGIVLALAIAYVHWGTSVVGSGLLYGIIPVVVAIVANALVGLLRVATRGRVLLWGGAAAAFLAYLANANVLIAFFGVALGVMLIDNSRRLKPGFLAIAPVAQVTRPFTRRASSLPAIFFEFLKLGAIVFGSGYVLLAFLRRDLVGGTHWLSTRELLDAVAVGQITPGPVFTTATFIGYLVGGFGGAIVATLGIFLPSFVMMMALAPVVPRLRRSPWTSAALDGCNAAALGLMAGVSVDLGRAAIVDPLTAVLAVIALFLLVTKRASSVTLIGLGAVVGLLHVLL